MSEKQQGLGKGSGQMQTVFDIDVFDIDPESALFVQRILDILRAPKSEPTDPKIIEEEIEELWP